jgi:hypothetical protein
MSAAVLEPARLRVRALWNGMALRAGWPMALVALAGLGLVAGILIIDAAPVGVYADDAMYVILARSVATGQGLRVLNLPGAPFATHFPPGYPLMLAALWRLMPSFPENVLLFKAFNAVCLGVVSVGIARYARQRFGAPRLALLLGAVTAVSVPLLFLGAMLLSELSFLALLLLLLPTMERFAEERAPWWKAIALGVAVGACALVRTHGFVLAPALGLVLVSRGRWRDAMAVVAAAVVTMLPWQLWSAHHAGLLPAPLVGTYGSYGAWWRDGFASLGARIFPLTLARTLPQTGATFAVLFSPLHHMVARAVTMVLLIVATAVTVRAYWRRIPVTLVFLLGYLTILELWPGPPTRMIWGVWPLFLALFAAGMHTMVNAARDRSPALRVATISAVVWLVAGYGIYQWRGIRGRWWETVPRGAAAQIHGLVAWTRTHTRPDDVVATDAEGAVFLYTGRRTVPVRAFKTDQFLAEPAPAPAVEAERGLVPILSAYPVRAVATASQGSYAAAVLLTVPPNQLLTPAGRYPWGATFTVVAR